MIRGPSIHRRHGAAGALLLVVLVTIAIIALIYFGNFGGKSYVQTTVDSKEHAREVVGQVNLASLYASLRIYAAANDGKFPPTPEELVKAISLPKGYIFLVSKPADDGLMTYVGRQSESMPAENILLYESVVGSDGGCTVLRLDGKVERLTAEGVREVLSEMQGQRR